MARPGGTSSLTSIDISFVSIDDSLLHHNYWEEQNVSEEMSFHGNDHFTQRELSADMAAWAGPEDGSGKFYLLWDDKYIYIAVVMKDDKLSQNKTGSDIWNADAVEVFFSTTNAVPDCSEHYQYGFDFKEQRWNWCNMDGNGSAEPDYLQIASTETDDGYICEAAIEYGQMLSLDWSVGSTIGFHPVFDDTDNVDRELQMTWTGRAAHDQSLGYGYLILSDAEVNPGPASGPSPANGAKDVSMAAILSWTAADNAASHEVYLGTDKNTVGSADIASPEYKGAKALGAESYDVGLLEADTTYYWRVDEVYAGNTVKGPVWTFTVGSHLLIDDFESYTHNDADGEAIWQTWIDGFGVADNGAQVGNLMPPYCEQRIVHGGLQSMPLFYVNEAGVSNSEASLTLTAPRDWTAGGVADLSLWIRGDSANAIDPLYVAVTNSAGGPAIIVNDDPEAVIKTAWKKWLIPLQSIADQGINLGNVDKIAISVGSKAGAAAGGSGTTYIDDIRLYRP